MRDKRTVDDLSIEELERILAIKKRQARQEQLQRMQRTGRTIQPGEAQPPNHGAGLPTGVYSPQFEADIDPGIKRKNTAGSSLWRRFVDRSLLLVEIAAVLGIIAVGFVMLEGIQTLQQETADAQSRADEQIRAAIPTIAPTPQLTLANIVLPGGHTPPTEAGGGQFNFDEIPAGLRAQVRDLIFLPPEIARPPITPETARRIVIPDINVDQVIVQGIDWEAMKNGVGQLQNGVNPGSSGNVVLAAHNDIYGEIFRHLDELEPGTLFEIHTEKQVYTYVITGSDIVEPSEVGVMDNQSRPTATLISCYPYQVNTHRIVIFADRVDT